MSNPPQRGGRSAGQASDRTTKADKKEQARQEREDIQRRMAAKKRNRTIGLVAGLGAAVLVVILVALLGGGGSDDQAADGDTGGAGQPLPGLLTTPGPWPANNEQLAARLAELDFPPFLDEAGKGQHHHVRLWIYVGGEPSVVPADLSFDQARGVASPLHTHDATGLVHVESADPTWQPTMGDLFDSWGVRLSSTCIGGNCAADELQLRVFVDGQEQTGDIRDVPLEDQKAYVIVFGTEDQLPDPLPDSFAFTEQ